ncbi:MAG: sigma-70 family RNA polymerase sigma factor [Gemmatimonadales bacterium]
MIHDPPYPDPNSARFLVERMAARDERALSALYDRFGGMLYAMALRLAGEQADAEEIVLDAFSQAWRDATTFRPDRGSVAAWLVTICRSRALDLVRARGRRVRLTEAAAAIVEPGHAPAMGKPAPNSDAGEGTERRDLIAKALRSLSAVQRQAVELAFFHGLSHSEIATRLGEPLGTIKTRVRLGMQKLKDDLVSYYSREAT